MPDLSMRSLATVAWGMILVILDFRINGIDLIPDPVGWVLVAVGARSLTRTADQVFPAARTWFAGVGTVALVALLPSLPDWVGVNYALLDAVASLAQVVVVVAMCTALMAALPARRSTARAVRTAAVVTSIAAWVTAFAAREESALVPVVVLAVLAAIGVVIWFLVLLFGAAKDSPPQPA